MEGSQEGIDNVGMRVCDQRGVYFTEARLRWNSNPALVSLGIRLNTLYSIHGRCPLCLSSLLRFDTDMRSWKVRQYIKQIRPIFILCFSQMFCFLKGCHEESNTKIQHQFNTLRGFLALIWPVTYSVTTDLFCWGSFWKLPSLYLCALWWCTQLNKPYSPESKSVSTAFNLEERNRYRPEKRVTG